MTIVTPRLILRPHAPGNAARINAWENDAELSYLTDDAPPRVVPLAETESWLASRCRDELDERGVLHYAIHLRNLQEPRSLVGCGSIAFVDTFNLRCRVGLTIGEKSHWGRGYGREALAFVLARCFSDYGLHRVGAEIYSFNVRSIRLFEALGFLREGVVRESVWKNGRFEDEYIYGLLREDWERLRE